MVVADIAATAGEETSHLAGHGAIAIRTDVTDEVSLQAAIRTTLDTFGRLDVLHNNAAPGGRPRRGHPGGPTAPQGRRPVGAQPTP